MLRIAGTACGITLLSSAFSKTHTSIKRAEFSGGNRAGPIAACSNDRDVMALDLAIKRRQISYFGQKFRLMGSSPTSICGVRSMDGCRATIDIHPWRFRALEGLEMGRTGPRESPWGPPDRLAYQCSAVATQSSESSSTFIAACVTIFRNPSITCAD